MDQSTSKRLDTAHRRAAHPQATEQRRRPLSRRAAYWLSVCIAAVVAAVFLCVMWSMGAASGMSADDFKQMYESGPAADPACPQCSFP